MHYLPQSINITFTHLPQNIRMFLRVKFTAAFLIIFTDVRYGAQG